MNDQTNRLQDGNSGTLNEYNFINPFKKGNKIFEVRKTTGKMKRVKKATRADAYYIFANNRSHAELKYRRFILSL